MFRILALDGGGIRGAYSAGVLAAVEKATGSRIADYFDLITGTSTGGILGLALAFGVPAATVVDLYQRRGPDIFPSARWWERASRFARQAVAPKYSATALTDALIEVFGDRYLGEARCRLAIPAYDVVSNSVHVFKTAHDARLVNDFKRRVVEVAVSTAAAPTYFPRSLTNAGEQLIDGGVWANCPAMVGVAEALRLGSSVAEINLLSIGTLADSRTFAQAARRGGVFGYGLRGLLNLVMDAQARAALAQTRLLLEDRLYRIDQAIAPGIYALDDARAVPDLLSLGAHSGRTHVHEVTARFLVTPVVPFRPVYSVPLSPA